MLCVCVCACLNRPRCLCLPPADLHLLRVLTCIFQGTFMHSFIHSFIHLSSYITHLHGRPSWNPCPRRMYTTVPPRRWSKKEAELLCSSGTDCTYGAWALGPYGDTGLPITQQQSTSGLRCQVTTVAAGGGGGRSRRIHVFLSFSALPLFLFFPFLFLAGVSPSRPACPTGDTPSDLEPLTEEGLTS